MREASELIASEHARDQAERRRDWGEEQMRLHAIHHLNTYQNLYTYTGAGPTSGFTPPEFFSNCLRHPLVFCDQYV